MAVNFPNSPILYQIFNTADNSFIWNGSQWVGYSTSLVVNYNASSVVIQDDNSIVGATTSINFGSNLDVSFDGGVATIDATGGGGESYWVETSVGIHTLSNVGVGTTNPTSKLTVSGDARITGVVTATTFIGALTGTSTNSQGLTGTPNLNVGVVTATSFVGNLTGTASFATVAGIATYTSEWILGAVGSSDYTFTGPGFTGAESDPVLYLVRGQQYKFTNTMGAHPFRIQSTVNGSTGTQYDDGIVNNNVSNGTLTWNVQFDAPNILYYQCTAHGSMGGKIYIIDAGVGPDISINTTGIITATTFSGNLVGSITDATNLTGGTANASSLNVSGIATISQGRIQADASSNLRFGNVAAGSGSVRNIAIGDQVLVSLSGGQGRNIGVGELSYYDTTTGQYNIGVGERAGQKVSTGSYNVILGAYDGNSGGLDIRTSSRNVVIADGEGNIRQYINSSGNVGIKTTVVTEALTVSGIVSATSFYGTLNAEQLTGTLPAIDGSALIGVVGSGSGVIIEEDGTPVGTAGTINFGSNLDVSFSGGTATVSGVSSVSTATTAFNLAGSPNLNVGVVTASRLISNTTIGIGTESNTRSFYIYQPTSNIRAESTSSSSTAAISFVNDIGNPLFVGKAGTLYNNPGYPDILSNYSFIYSDGDSPIVFGTNAIARLIIKASDGNIGVGTTNATSKLTVSGNTLVSGIITASSFSGSGSGLTNLQSAQLSGALPAIDGSALLNVTASGTGVVVEDDQVNVGSATTIDFGTGLDVTFSAGIATITASGGSLQSRTTVSGVTTSIANLGIGNTDITGFKSYALMRVGLSTAGWLRIYTDSASRDADVSRSIGEDPVVGSGVIAEVVTTGISTTQIISPFVMGGNLDNPADTTIYASIKNLSGSTQSITANLTILQLEA